MDRLTFSHNWNRKLDSEVFSTIRLWNPEIHYEGKEVEIYDNSTNPGKYKGRGKYAIVSEFKLNQLKPAAAMLDTGYPLDETINIIKTMYFKKVSDLEKQSFAYIIIKKVKVQPQQNKLEL